MPVSEVTNAPESWVKTWAEVEARQRDARDLIGAHVNRVRYVNIDYNDMDRAGSEPARRVTGADEWASPTWLFSACHSVDWGVELDVQDDEGMALTWQKPGWHEGLVLYRGVLVERAVSADAIRAEWDMTSWGDWPRALADPITDVDLRYEPWGDPQDDGFWCRLVTVTFGPVPVRFLLGEGRVDSDEVQPSADNVAILFPEHQLPAWADP